MIGSSGLSLEVEDMNAARLLRDVDMVRHLTTGTRKAGVSIVVAGRFSRSTVKKDV